MTRYLLAALLALSTCAVALASACNASVTESCLGGPCATDTGGMAGAGGKGADSGADACPAKPKTGDFPCDVFAVIHTNCNPCHQNPPMNNAPFPLLTYSDTQQPFLPGKLIFQQMYDQTRPTACPRMPLGGMLDAADLATLTAWLTSCAPPEPSGKGCGCVSQWSGNGCTPL
jgi:hypothetical protein